MDPISVGAGLTAFRMYQQRKAKRKVDDLSDSHSELAQSHDALADEHERRHQAFLEEHNEHLGGLAAEHDLLVQEHLALRAQLYAVEQARLVSIMLSACAAVLAAAALIVALLPA